MFEEYRFEGTELVVEFRDTADVRKVVLYNSSTDEEYEVIEHPPSVVRFRVVFPDRMDTSIADSLHVKAKTSDGWAEEWISETVHAHLEGIEVLQDGRARFDVMNQGRAPLLIQFVGIYGDVPNPTVDPQNDSFDRSSLDYGPSIIGIGENRPLTPSRTDLVVPSGETASFETRYAPFAFLNGADAADCSGKERTGQLAVVHASGGSASYSFSYRLSGDPTAVEGRSAEICNLTDSPRN
ncbi:hypothetical protein ACFO3H_07590 [Halorussus sp. GCM10023401]|uniref:hypothetical protein n=1 Tax=Halorussus vallis TaxID=2953749 RepID=UPI0020A165DD|nr:hypothetical protein [Halorussus vallis]